MTIRAAAHRLFVIGSCVVLTVTGCAFHGLNSLPLPGAVGRGPGAQIFHVEIANVGSMEANSPVMVNDVVVGSISKMTVRGWHADVEVAVRPDVVVPANAVAKVGQTSLLGSMHLELNPPLGEQGTGRLQPGATIPLSKSSSYPSTEQTLSSISVIVNAGGLGQISDIIHNFSGALSGRENQVRDLLNRLDTFVGEFDDQRDNIVASIQGLNRVSATFASQRDVITRALREISPGLEVLLKERPRITTALDKLRVFSDTATRLINDTQTDLVKNLQNLQADVLFARRGRPRPGQEPSLRGIGVPLRPESHRPRCARRLLQCLRRHRHHPCPAEESDLHRHPLATEGPVTCAGAGRPWI